MNAQMCLSAESIPTSFNLINGKIKIFFKKKTNWYIENVLEYCKNKGGQIIEEEIEESPEKRLCFSNS